MIVGKALGVVMGRMDNGVDIRIVGAGDIGGRLKVGRVWNRK